MEISKVYKKDKIKLYFSLANCHEESTYRIEFRMIDSEDSEETFITEEKRNKLKNGTLNFSKTFTYEYDFSKIQSFKLDLKRWGQSKFTKLPIKEKYHLCLSSIISSKNSVFKTKSKENTDDCETVIISAENAENSNLEKSYKSANFFDYLKSGIQFNSFIIIDFTEENLHHNDLNTNQFLQAIQGFRETLYEFVKCFKVYGYGANLKGGENSGKKYFNLSMEENPEIAGFTKIMNKYNDCLEKIAYEKKGYLSPVLENIKKEIYNIYCPDIYNIIFLLIHNLPSDDDVKKCSDFMIESSKLPISIITIFMGDKPEEEIKDLKKIFSNKKKMSSNYVERTRNNVSFFSMKNCNFNNDILKNKCLREIPEQLVDYYKLNITSPKDITEKKLDKIRESYKEFDPQLSLYQDEFCAPSIGEQKPNNINNENKIEVINENGNKKKIKDDDDNEYINKPGFGGKEGYKATPTPGDDIINNDKNDKNKNNNLNSDNKIYINVIDNNNNNNINNNNNSKNIKNPFQKKPNLNKINNNNNEIQNQNQNQNKIRIEDGNDLKFDKPNLFQNEEKIKNTPNPDSSNINIGNKKIINNPFKRKKEVKKEEQKEENKIEVNEIKLNNINNNENKINENIIIKEEKKYVNIINNDNNNIYNKFNEDKKYKNTPNPDDNNQNKFNEDRKYKNTPNPDDLNQNKFIFNPFQNKAKEDEQEKKYQNATPGNNINENPTYKVNPFKNKNKNEIIIEKNEIKEEDVKEEKKEQKVKKETKIGSHFKKKYSKDITKLSTKSSNREENLDYSRDN